MFFYLLIGTLVLGSIHGFRLKERTVTRVAETVLIYLLVGYCGLAMLAVSIGLLAAPERMAMMLPVGPPTPLVAFFGWAYLSMSVLSLLTLRYRGNFLVAPAICWSIYMAGATLVHLSGADIHGSSGHAAVLSVLATHGLVAVLLVTLLILSGSWRAGEPDGVGKD